MARRVNVTEERTELTAVDKMSGPMTQAKSSTRALRSEVEVLKGVLGALGVTVGIGTILQVGRQALQAAQEAEQAGARLTATLRVTGNQIGITRAQLDQMAGALSRSTQFDDESITNAQAQLVKFGNIHNQAFTRALKVSTDYAAFMGTDVSNAAQTVGRALSAPARGLSLLERQIGALEPMQRMQIEQLVEQNRLYEAQGAILTALEGKLGTTAEQMNTGLTKAVADLTKEWNELLEAMGRTEGARSPTVTFLSAVTDYLGRWRDIIENGTWTEKLIAIMAALSPASIIHGQKPQLTPAGRTVVTGQMPGAGPQLAFEDMLGGPADMAALDFALKRQEEARKKALEHQKEMMALEGTLVKIRGDGLDWAEQALSVEEDHAKVVELGLTRVAEAEAKRVALETTLVQLRGDGTDALEEALAVEVDLAAVQRLRRASLDEELRKQDEVWAWRISQAEKFNRTIEEGAKRNQEILAQSITDGIMQGFDRGEDFFENFSRRLKSAVLTITIQPVVLGLANAMAAPFAGLAQAGSSSLLNTLGLGPSMFGGGGLSGMGGIGGLGAFAGGFGTGITSSAATTAALIESGTVGAAGAGIEAAALGGIGGALPWVGGALLLGGALGLFGGREKDRTASAGFSAGFGQNLGTGAFDSARYVSHATHGAALGAFSTLQATREQNLIRNLGLDSSQIAAVDAALVGTHRRYGLAAGKDSPVDPGALEQIAAARLQAISQALGKSIEELTSVMAMSAEQWDQAIEQLEQALQGAKDTLAAQVRSLPEALGISGLEDYQRTLATGEDRAPLDRLGAARSFYEETLAKAMGGDLDAARAFPGAAQGLLGIGRETFASGAGYQDLFREVNISLNEVLERQRGLQADILRDVPTAIIESSRDQIAELRRGFTLMVEKLEAVQTELQRMQAA